MIRRTIKDSYGFAHSSPFQYLQRLADFSELVPQAPVSFLGASLNPRGNGVVWTVQPYIEGTLMSSTPLLKKLEQLGWKEVKGAPQHLVYEHTQTKILMHDAHPGNFIETKDGQLVPIDVFFEWL